MVAFRRSGKQNHVINLRGIIVADDIHFAAEDWLDLLEQRICSDGWHHRCSRGRLEPPRACPFLHSTAYCVELDGVSRNEYSANVHANERTGLSLLDALSSRKL